MEMLDCRGLACPQPVIRCRDAVDAGSRELGVLVDNEPARENVSRFFQSRGFAVNVSAEAENCWRVTARAWVGDVADNPAEGTREQPAQGGSLKTLVLLTTETLGRGDDELGGRLMQNFLATLPELGQRLWRVVLLNGGVKLSARPGPALDALRALADSGVSILVCGACLGHYGLLEQKAVGETSNMLDIVTSLDLADKVIRP